MLEEELEECWQSSESRMFPTINFSIMFSSSIFSCDGAKCNFDKKKLPHISHENSHWLTPLSLFLAQFSQVGTTFPEGSSSSLQLIHYLHNPIRIVIELCNIIPNLIIIKRYYRTFLIFRYIIQSHLV